MQSLACPAATVKLTSRLGHRPQEKSSTSELPTTGGAPEPCLSPFLQAHSRPLVSPLESGPIIRSWFSNPAPILEGLLPDVALGPPAEPLVHALVLAVSRRQVIERAPERRASRELFTNMVAAPRPSNMSRA